MQRFKLYAIGKNVADLTEYFDTLKQVRSRERELYTLGYSSVWIADNKLSYR
jgi:hypothetical protein